MKFDKHLQEQVNDLFVSYNKPDSPGFVVGIVYKGEIVFRQGFGQATLEHFSPITSDTVFDVGSLAKQFVGMAIALLAEDGQLSLRDKMCTYLAEFPDYAKEITLANLLYHTSGIRNYTVLAYYMMGYHESDAMTSEEVYDLLLKLPSLNFKPGERWEYSDSNYFLLAKIVERIAGISFGEYARQVIFDPLEMHSTLFRECHSQVIRNRAMSYVTHPVAFRSPYLYRDQREGPGAFHTLISNYEHVGAEGLFTSLEDLFKWNMNFLENRLGRNGSDLIASVLAPGVQINEDIGYGFGINVGKFKGKKFYGHDGAIHGYTSSMMHFPEENVSIICLANHDLESAWEYRDRIIDLIFPGNSSTVSPHQPSPDREVYPDDRVIAGSYQNSRTAAIWRVAFRNNRVFITENDHWEFELARVEPFVYRVARPTMELRFVLDSAGKVSKIEGFVGEQSFTFVPFLPNLPSTGDLAEYIGEYCSPELGITFVVDIDGQRLIVRNKAKHFCSMDLFYTPTIKDSFIAYDPHPKSSQITFLRKEGAIDAFIFRDYDGDGREDIRFVLNLFTPDRRFSAMDIPRIFNITESAHRIHNPITPEKLATLGAALRLESGARVLDLGSGSGEMLCTWARDHGITGTGIDLSQLFTEQAKRRAEELGVAGQVKFIHGDAAGYVSDEKVNVAACLGATWIGGGVAGTIELLAQSLAPGGMLLIGEPYWRQLPPTEDVARWCHASSISDFLLLPELLASFGHLGCDVVEMVLADQDGWDRYEAAKWLTMRRWLEANPADELAPEVRAKLTSEPARYAAYTREYLGWGVFALMPLRGTA